MSVLNKFTLLLVVVFGCVGCDQTTKYTARLYFDGKPRISFMGDTVRIDYAENRGAFLGFGSSLPKPIRTGLFAVLASILLFGFLVYTLRIGKSTKKEVLAAGLIVGGGVSNLIDRWVNHGAVIDFLNLGIGSFRTGILNVADMAIMLGVVMYLFSHYDVRSREP